MVKFGHCNPPPHQTTQYVDYTKRTCIVWSDTTTKGHHPMNELAPGPYKAPSGEIGVLASPKDPDGTRRLYWLIIDGGHGMQRFAPKELTPAAEWPEWWEWQHLDIPKPTPKVGEFWLQKQYAIEKIVQIGRTSKMGDGGGRWVIYQSGTGMDATWCGPDEFIERAERPEGWPL